MTPKFNIISEPKAQITWDWRDLSLIREALWDHKDDLDLSTDDRQRVDELTVFIDHVQMKMAEHI